MTLRDTGRGCIHPTLLHCPGCMLQRYVETGQARILSKTRGVVGLHKNRVCFPLSLCVARLSGVGSDTLFIGVMKHEPSIGTLDKPIMRVSCPSLNPCCSTSLSAGLVHQPTWCTYSAERTDLPTTLRTALARLLAVLDYIKRHHHVLRQLRDGCTRAGQRSRLHWPQLQQPVH